MELIPEGKSVIKTGARVSRDSNKAGSRQTLVLNYIAYVYKNEGTGCYICACVNTARYSCLGDTV